MAGHVLFGIAAGLFRLSWVTADRFYTFLKHLLCAIKDHSADNFASKYQNVGTTDLTIR
jgi:hypothetical protein